MFENLNTKIVTQEQVIFAGPADSIVVPAAGGQMGILKNHAPLMAALAVGVLKIHDGADKKDYFAVSGGFVQVKNNRVIILADRAVNAEKVNREENAGEINKLNAALNSAGKAEKDELKKDLEFLEAKEKAIELASSGK